MTKRHSIGITIVLLGIVIAFLQLLATEHFLYWEFWWYDIMMHFLGGLFIGTAFLWFLKFEFKETTFPVFLLTFGVVLAVGVAWEVFEYFTDSYNARNYTLDTTLDLATDIVGMMAAYLFFKRI